MRRLLLTCGLLILTGCAQGMSDDGNASSSSHTSVTSVPSATSATSVPSTPPRENIPALQVPFTSQAPHANWGDPYQEACEEAAILMAVYYRKGKTFTPEIADRAILDLVQWETEHGYAQDITAAQMAEVAEAKFGVRARVRTDVTEDSIKEELAAGNPVVIPAAGRDLGNPYFSGEGPWYHALVIIGFKHGWTGDYFITNDPGTKRGEHYEYHTDVLLNAIHDWTGVKEGIRQGGKAMVILEK